METQLRSGGRRVVCRATPPYRRRPRLRVRAASRRPDRGWGEDAPPLAAEDGCGTGLWQRVNAPFTVGVVNELGAGRGACYTRAMIAFRFPLVVVVVVLAGMCWQGRDLRAAEAAGGEFKLVANLAYKSGAGLSEYEQQRCKLDLVLPVGRTNFATLVWLHGGGLTGGSKSEGFAKQLARAFGVAVASANYRLSPLATYPAYLDDAAAAVAWVQGNIAAHGGDTNRVFVGGHSAGAYLTSMVGLDARHLAKHGLGAGALAGLIAVSGQTMTHFTVRT